MVCGLFSSFDPSFLSLFGYNLVPLKWLMSFILVFFFCKWRVFFSLSGMDILEKKFISFVFDLINQSMKSISMTMSIGLVLYSLFFFFFFSNLLGLVPNVLTLSSHLCINLGLSLVLWLGGVFFFLKKSIEMFLSHMVPFGAPVFLLPLLVLIETISLLIRPLTLAIRLMANVMAGHLIMGLVGEMGSSMGLEFVFPVLLETGFLMFEVCVAVVQAYVFFSLLSMYLSEGVEE